MNMKFKKVLTILLTFSILLALSVSISAKNIPIRTPEYKAIDQHNAQITELFTPDQDIIFATLLNNKASERTEYIVSDTYAWQDNYTDAIFFYEGENTDWNDAVHLDLTNNVFSFSLSQPMFRGEELAVIFDDGTSVWINYVDQKDFHNNMYSIPDVYTLDFVNVMIIAYLEDLNEYDVPVRYAYILAEERVASNMPSAGNEIIEFTLPGQVGDTIIDNINKTITILMPAGTDVSSMIPENVVYSNKALVYPSVSAKQNFTKKVIYNISAEDFTKNVYTVNVIVPKVVTTYPIIYPSYYNWCNSNNYYYYWMNQYYKTNYSWWTGWSGYYPPCAVCGKIHKLP
jgi:hypothetical protein